MGLFDIFRRLVRRPAAREPAPRSRLDRQDSAFGQTEAAAWLAALESGRLDVPRDVHDAEAWDRYWMAQIECGPMEQGFGDMMASDPQLVPALDRRGARTILCVGNGLSSESWVLALHGFDVTVLDISTVPAAAFRAMVRDPSHAVHRMGGIVVRDESAIAFDPAVPVDPESCPAMHRTTEHLPKGGGSLAYVTGDLMNPDLCPGPFDVVVERRTVQLFRTEERSAALDRLEARLAPSALFVSHQHCGGWKPGEPRSHYATQWALDRGFAIDWAPTADSPARVAQLLFTTG